MIHTPSSPDHEPEPISTLDYARAVPPATGLSPSAVKTRRLLAASLAAASALAGGWLLFWARGTGRWAVFGMLFFHLPLAHLQVGAAVGVAFVVHDLPRRRERLFWRLAAVAGFGLTLISALRVMR